MVKPGSWSNQYKREESWEKPMEKSNNMKKKKNTGPEVIMMQTYWQM